ncbi:hypothetical protein HYH03_017645 [Edaphochlamys debaryana]|uniref:Nuclear envelope membrane protein n=1 Tax=Edaphochlamys debaryana TaxID=47281 RepID=A0A836BP27_9CHLO|nr:hypothetical protein HYH03_017645 [Edaphochlamys debaryana]|eukprot:KAG2483462.1 hypothetical protein HYH03_017645 [Edaphochlamys debaryana]
MSLTAVWLSNFVSGHTINAAGLLDLRLPDWQAGLVDVALMALLSVQHNVMARPAVKARMRRLVPFPWERSLFAAAASLALCLVMLMWQPLPALVWTVRQPYGTIVTCVGALGMAVILTSAWGMQGGELLGLTQAWLGVDAEDFPRHPFVLNPFYRRVRHPQYLGLLVALFATPTMSVGRLLFACYQLAFVLWSLALEEGDLEREYGTQYKVYRKAVPALVPRITPYMPEREAAEGEAANVAGAGATKKQQ